MLVVGEGLKQSSNSLGLGLGLGLGIGLGGRVKSRLLPGNQITSARRLHRNGCVKTRQYRPRRLTASTRGRHGTDE
jgi:hypothetical protein